MRRFPNALRIGDMVYLSSQPITPIRRAAGPTIQEQTHEAFSDFVSLLDSVGTRMADLVKLHTFYVFGGETNATTFWEQMTEVRLQYFSNPGTAGTALRVKGAPTRERLIAIDGIARIDVPRQRIMPAHAWDWSMPTPLSQGWRVGPVIYAGGQISADRRGRTVAPDDVDQQAINTMEFLRHVLTDAGSTFDDVVTLKVAYQDHGDPETARATLDRILKIAQPLVKPERCALTCLGVDLLYEGLKLEIDAVAALAEPGTGMVTGVGQGWCGASGFATARQVGGLSFVGAIGAPEETSLEAQSRVSLERLAATLQELGSDPHDLAKVNVLVTGDDASENMDYETVRRILDVSLPHPGPVVTIVRVAGLPQRGQRVQVDAVAVGPGPTRGVGAK